MCGEGLPLPISLTGWSQRHFVSSIHHIIPHNFHPYRCAAMLLLSLYFTGTISAGARRSLAIVFRARNIGVAVQGQRPLRTIIVSRRSLRASVVVVPAFFHPQLSCGTLYLLLFFPPLTICLPLNVGSTGTWGPFNFFYNFVLFYFIFLILHILAPERLDFVVGPQLASVRSRSLKKK